MKGHRSQPSHFRFVSKTTESRDTNTNTNTGYLLTRICSSTIHNGPKVEATRVSTDGPVNAQNEFYTHNGGVFGLKKEGDGVGNGNPLQYSCLEIPMDRGTWWAAVPGVSKSWTQLSINIQNRLTDTENRLGIAKEKRERGGMDWEFGVSRCKLLYLACLNKVQLYSTGNYIHYPVINHD